MPSIQDCRRSSSARVLSALFLVAAANSATVQVARGDGKAPETLQPRGGPAHAGYSEAAEAFDYPARKWVVRPPAWGSPVVRGDLAYFGGPAITVVDVTTGSTKFSWKPESAARGWRAPTPVVDEEGKVFYRSVDGQVGCGDPSVQKPAWTYSGASLMPYNPWPLVVTDKLVVAAFASNVVGLDRKTGEVRWRSATFETRGNGPALDLLPAADDRSVFVATSAGRVAALNLEDGTERWHRDLPVGFAQNHPAVVKKWLLLVDRPPVLPAKLRCFDATSGESVWDRDIEGSTGTEAVWDGAGSVAVGFGRTVRIVTLATGKTERDFPCPANPFGGIAITAKRVYFGCLDGSVTAVDRATSAVVWRLAFGGATPSGLVFVRNRLFVTTPQGTAVFESRARAQDDPTDIPVDVTAR